MSSVSSHEGSEKDSFFHHRGFPDGLPHRYAAMRKIDLLDAFEAVRHRDTDAWSVAATIDDQESVISGVGGPSSVIGSSRATVEERETDDDRSTLDGLEGNPREGMNASSLNDNASLQLDNLCDLDGRSVMHDNASTMTDDDKRSRSNAAEFGDDGTRSEVADFDGSDTSDDEVSRSGPRNVVNDDISAPPQPQPSFASNTKSYTELLEENEMLQARLRTLKVAQKQQAAVIENLRSLTGCDEEVYGRALDLSHVTPDELERWNEQSKDVLLPTVFSSRTPDISNQSMTTALTSESMPPSTPTGVHDFDTDMLYQASPVTNSHTLSQHLNRLSELLSRFVHEKADVKWQFELEEQLFTLLTHSFLETLPFGTENQQLLNLAYADQIRRFQTTLGTSFSKWYRRQTVQSLSLNPASKEYLEKTRQEVTQNMIAMLTGKLDVQDNKQSLYNVELWNEILDLCSLLSLEMHGGDADASVQAVTVGSKYDDQIMTSVGDVDDSKERIVKFVISPLFVDENDMVLLPARVLLE